jgi:hypothetical protein
MTRVRVILIASTIAALASSVAMGASVPGTTGHARPASARYESTPRLQTAASNAAAAQADAESLLAQLELPSGAEQSTGEPAGEDSLLARPGSGPPATPNVVDVHAWWLVPDAPKQVLAYIREHLPAEARHALSSSLAGSGVPPNETEGFAWPPIAQVLSTRQLVVEVVQLPSGSTALRADAEVVWVTPRPVSETVPLDAHLLRVSVLHTLGSAPRHGGHPFTFTATGKIDRAVALINELPAGQPGVRNCPADFGVLVRLAFYPRPRSAASAIAKIDPGGCRGVRLTLRGVTQPPLEGQALPGSTTPPRIPLVTQLDRILGVKLDVAPRA